MHTKAEVVFSDRLIVFAVSTQLDCRFAMSSAGDAMTRPRDNRCRIFQASILLEGDEVDNVV